MKIIRTKKRCETRACFCYCFLAFIEKAISTTDASHLPPPPCHQHRLWICRFLSSSYAFLLATIACVLFLHMSPSSILSRQNSKKVSLPPAAPDPTQRTASHRPFFLINTGDCCLTASDSREHDAARAEARKMSGWSSSIQQPYRPLGAIAPVLLPHAYRKKGNGARNGHPHHAFAPHPLAPFAAPHLQPHPPAAQLNLQNASNDGVMASARSVQDDSRGAGADRGRGGSLGSRRRLVTTDAVQADAAALDSFRWVSLFA